MSIVINLLPDIRQAKLRDRHRRQLFFGISILIWAVSGAVVVLLGIYAAGEALVIRNVSNTINTQKNQVQNISGLTTALTAEEHLSSLPSLYNERVYLSQFFKDFQAIDPGTVDISTLTVDSGNNLTIGGTATDYTAVGTLARAMEDANVGSGTSATSTNTPYFTGVTIVSAGSVSGGVSFSIQAVVGTEVVSGSGQ
jgi:Tfp pilus assembly protein PilN